MVKPDRSVLRVLIAEDEALAALALDDVLTECGHSVTLAADGEEALRLARAFHFDVLITDLAMPRMTGWELIHSLRVEQPDLPAVVMTGYLPPGGRELLFNGTQAPVELLLKPFDINRLVKVLDQLVPRAPVPVIGPGLAQLMRAAG